MADLQSGFKKALDAVKSSLSGMRDNINEAFKGGEEASVLKEGIFDLGDSFKELAGEVPGVSKIMGAYQGALKQVEDAAKSTIKEGISKLDVALKEGKITQQEHAAATTGLKEKIENLKVGFKDIVSNVGSFTATTGGAIAALGIMTAAF